MIYRHFTDAKTPETVETSLRHAIIKDADGSVIFEQPDVEFPVFWSDTAVNIVASKYFYGTLGTSEREHSLSQLIDRVVNTITQRGHESGYFKDAQEAQTFSDELYHIVVHQKAAFNSPVWFNCGVHDQPQSSACFINSVEDTMESILDLVKTEGMLFKAGSGTGTNFSTLRSSQDSITGGGHASGPVSFLRGYDMMAGTIKSGGRTRRSARMSVLNVDHPDIIDFITCKAIAENHTRTLIEQGFDGSFEGEIYGAALFQNSNHSVRVPDAFMVAAQAEDEWATYLKTGGVADKYNAKELLFEMAKAAHATGDPGIQFDTAINDWHTCKTTDRIYASNPCLAGDTYVDTDRGKIMIRELADMCSRGETLPYALAWDTTNHRATAAQITKAWKTRNDADLVEVVTDKGLRFKCTPDHKILVREGGRSSNEAYIQADQLTHGASLRVWPRGRVAGRSVINDRFDTYYEHVLIWESIFGPVPEGCEIHHKDGDRENHAIDNLECVNSYAHRVLHSSGPNNPMYGRDRKGEKALVNAANRRWANTPPDVKIKTTERKREARIQCGISKIEDIIKITGEIPSPEVYDTLRGSYKPTSEWLAEQFTSWDLVLEEVLHPNHKVVSVTPCPSEDVYDLSVPGPENFVISDNPDRNETRDGIVVHNCSEFVFLDDTACNLSSINLMKTTKDEDFKQVVSVMILAQEILVGMSSYPTPAIHENSLRFRPLGLGYANLGALLMSKGIPYDSNEGRAVAAKITALMTGQAYVMSSKIAEKMGVFEGYQDNAHDMMGVMRMHAKSARQIGSAEVDKTWDLVLHHGSHYGFRNAQVTVLAPTGTISFMMDCSTTGIEPELALVKHKKLSGGGIMRLPNDIVAPTLYKLGYTDEEESRILGHIEATGTIEGSNLRDTHLPIFDCALTPANGQRSISPQGHIRMMAAVQPFLSGAISKTINMPHDTTIEDIMDVYQDAWEFGLKSVAVYRDGCKHAQPLNDTHQAVSSTSQRHRLPNDRDAKIHKFDIAGHEGYLTVGLYEDGSPGEMFIVISKQGSTLNGLMDAFATSISIALQHGVPLDLLIEKFAHTKFEPAGFTGNADIPIAKSIIDYVFRWMAYTFTDERSQAQVGVMAVNDSGIDTIGVVSDAPFCSECGELMVRNGACYKCTNCGNTSGCS